MRASIAARQGHEQPYPYFIVQDLFPAAVAKELATLPFRAPGLDGVSGKRELHNDTRRYFDAATNAEHPVMGRIAEALQAPRSSASSPAPSTRRSTAPSCGSNMRRTSTASGSSPTPTSA